MGKKSQASMQCSEQQSHVSLGTSKLQILSWCLKNQKENYLALIHAFQFLSFMNFNISVGIHLNTTQQLSRNLQLFEKK